MNNVVLKINVGGRIFQTQTQTLLKSPKFREILEKYNTIKDENGYIFIDRDGDSFCKVLNLLRTDNYFSIDLSLKEEYKYFGLIPDIFPESDVPNVVDLGHSPKITNVFKDFKKKVRMGGWTPLQCPLLQRIELESEYDRKRKECENVLVFVPHLQTLSKETNHELSLDKCCDLIRKIRVYGAKSSVLRFEGTNNFDIPFIPLGCGYKAPIKYIPVCLALYSRIKIVAKEKPESFSSNEPIYVTYESGFMSFKAKEKFMRKEYKDKYFSCSFGECQKNTNVY